MRARAAPVVVRVVEGVEAVPVPAAAVAAVVVVVERWKNSVGRP
jgi:hypothetical protein